MPVQHKRPEGMVEGAKCTSPIAQLPELRGLRRCEQGSQDMGGTLTGMVMGWGASDADCLQ